MKSSERRMTVYDIAKEAGVSASTVSRVLTGNGPVNEQKKELVLKILEKHEFRPSSVARSLKARRSRSVGFIVPDITNPFFSSMFLEVETRLAVAGYTVILCNSESRRERELEILQMLMEKEVEVIVLTGGIVDDLFPQPKMLRDIEKINHRVPIMTLSKFPGVRCTQAYSDEKQGVFDIVRHFHEEGHRKIGMIGGQMDVRQAFERKIYLLEAVNQYGMECRSNWLVEEGFSMQGGTRAMEKLLSLPERPSAVFAYNDVVAVGALSVIEKHGLKLGRELALAGMDGISLTESIYPGITTVAVDYAAFSDYVVEFVMNQGKGEQYKEDRVFPMHLICRGTTNVNRDAVHPVR